LWSAFPRAYTGYREVDDTVKAEQSRIRAIDDRAGTMHRAIVGENVKSVEVTVDDAPRGVKVDTWAAVYFEEVGLGS
jgi:hypothetical protein